MRKLKNQITRRKNKTKIIQTIFHLVRFQNTGIKKKGFWNKSRDYKAKYIQSEQKFKCCRTWRLSIAKRNLKRKIRRIPPNRKQKKNKWRRKIKKKKKKKFNTFTGSALKKNRLTKYLIDTRVDHSKLLFDWLNKSGKRTGDPFKMDSINKRLLPSRLGKINEKAKRITSKHSPGQANRNYWAEKKQMKIRKKKLR